MHTREPWHRPDWLTRQIGLSLLVLGLLGVACAGHRYRESFVRAFFFDGSGRAALPRLARPGPGHGIAPLPEVERVRVVLIDGLSRELSADLAHFDDLCARGYDLRVDTGFPTVSLPVQHVLWTGLTQAQTGILFRGKREILERPPLTVRGIPAQVPDSTAVAESHVYIVRALGFARVLPELPVAAEPGTSTDIPEGWSERGFAAAAEREVVGDAGLVFVHILGVDVAGHRQGGRDSAAYLAAARAADELLGRLLTADAAAHAGGTRWLVLSDHGHRGRTGYAPGGGHGGAEPDIRVVRACLADTPVRPGVRPDEPRTGYVHLIDVARSLADSLGVALPDGATGRPLQTALAAPVARDATLPVPGPWRTCAALVLIFLALVITGVCARGHGLALPYWWPISLFGLFWLEGVPSLSHPMVYRALHPMVFVPLAPGLIALAAQWGILRRSLSPGRAAVSLLCLPVCAALASVIMAAGLGAWAIAAWSAALLSASGIEPPLMPGYTAHASVLVALAYAAALVSAICLHVGLAVATLRRRRARGRVLAPAVASKYH